LIAVTEGKFNQKSSIYMCDGVQVADHGSCLYLMYFRGDWKVTWTNVWMFSVKLFSMKLI